MTGLRKGGVVVLGMVLLGQNFLLAKLSSGEGLSSKREKRVEVVAEAKEEKKIQKQETVKKEPRKLGPVKLSFEQFWEKVQAYYPNLQKQSARLEEAFAMRAQAWVGLLPRIQGRIGWEQTDDPTGVFMSKLKQESFTNDDFAIQNLNHPSGRSNTSWAFRLEMPIFDAFQTIASIRTSRHVVESREDARRFARMEASLLALNAYLQSILADKLSGVAEETLLASKKDLEEALSLKDQGLVLGADFFMGRVIASRIEQTVHAMMGRKRITQFAMNILQGEDPESPYVCAAMIPAAEERPKNLRQWLTEALLFRGDLASLHASSLAQESELGREKAKWMPYISAYGEREFNTHGFQDQGDNYTIGIQGKMDLFDPAYLPRVDASRARLDQIQQDEIALRDEIKKGILEAAVQYETILKNLSTAEQAAKDAREAVDSMAALYREGRKSIADLELMREMFLSAEAGYQEILTQTELQRAKLLFLSGQLDDMEIHKIARKITP